MSNTQDEHKWYLLTFYLSTAICPSGWNLLPSLNLCLFLSTDAATHSDAKANCSAIGGGAKLLNLRNNKTGTAIGAFLTQGNATDLKKYSVKS